MKKRFACMLLAVLLILPVLFMAGCGDDEETDEEEERLATTVTLMMVTNDSTTKEAVAQVQDALNNITMAKYKTQVILLTYTESEYEKALNKRFTALEEAAAAAKEAAESKKAAEKEAKKRGETIAKETTTVEVTDDETRINDDGFAEIKYPEMKDNQIDIFYLSGLDNLYEYTEAGRLADLDDVLGSSCKKLKDFIYPIFLDAAKIDGSTMAIINNHVIGEYTMLLVNKELADKYYYDPASFTSLTAAADFIDDMAVNEPSYTPFLKKVDYWGFKTWGDTERSIFGSDVASYTTYGKGVAAQIIFRSFGYRDHFMLMKRFEEAGYFSDDPDNDKNFAAAVVKGSIVDKRNYEEDYYVTVLQSPTATNENVYDGMFCVNGYNDSSRVKRSMEIVMLMNTDKQVRDLLQYGIEDVHYRLKDGKVNVISDDYSMKLINTGNEFISTPTVDMDADVWEIGKQQNLESSSYSMLSYHFSDDDLKLFAEANETAADIYALIENATYDELMRETVVGSYTNPFDAAIEAGRYVNNSNSITTSALDTNFGARLSSWFAANFPSTVSPT